MILITSAAYVQPGLVAEFGVLPPTMLPLQNRRLYYHQLRLFEDFDEDIVLSLPDGYVLGEYDKAFLDGKKVKVIYAPTNLSLGASVVFVLNVLGRFYEPIRILHGDTLFYSVPKSLDTFLISTATDDYQWTPVKDKNNSTVYTGYFAFSSQTLLIRCIAEHSNGFMAGVEAYSSQKEVQLVESDNWMDFGIANSYYRSKSKLTTQRVFNHLVIDKYSVTKYSKDSNKILAEANWFKSVPTQMKHFVPALWDSGIDGDRGFYEIEYFYLSSLADLFVFGHNSSFVWKGILDACSEFISQELSFVPEDKEAIAKMSVGLYRKKTLSRLSKYAVEKGISMDHEWVINGQRVPCLNQIVEEVSGMLDNPAPEFTHVTHGDFCFSNILYDFKSLSIKVLDPRGRDIEGNYSIYGDIRYDVAKLAHSVIGMYDFIVAGFYDFRTIEDDYSLELHFPEREGISEVQEYFNHLSFGGYNIRQLAVYPILVHLFLSMLPLHSDSPERQKAMLANALRLYTEYKRHNVS